MKYIMSLVGLAIFIIVGPIFCLTAVLDWIHLRIGKILTYLTRHISEAMIYSIDLSTTFARRNDESTM